MKKMEKFKSYFKQVEKYVKTLEFMKLPNVLSVFCDKKSKYIQWVDN